MEFFFPADVFATYPGQSRTGPSSAFSNCGFGSQAPLEDFFVDAIREERASQAVRARAYAAQQAAAIKRARAAQRAAELEQQKAAQEAQLRAYFEHVLDLRTRHEQQARQRQAQQEYYARLQRQREQEHRVQLQRQREQELLRRQQQYAEYQRQKAYAIQKERERVAALQAARENGKQLFLVLEDLLFDSLRAFFDDDDEPTEPTNVGDKSNKAADTATDAQADKGKAKAEDEAVKEAVQPDATNTSVAESDPEELGPVPTTEASTPVEESTKKAEPVSTATETSQTAQTEVAKSDEPILVFEHAFPSNGGFDKTSVQANAINVSVDEDKRTVTVSGLWNNEAAVVDRASSPTPSFGSGSQRGRSRSPKRARVSDVDENGNEIVTPEQQDATDDDFVEVHFHKSDIKPAATVQKTFSLPAGALVDNLRAELTDSGLKLYTSRAQ